MLPRLSTLCLRRGVVARNVWQLQPNAMLSSRKNAFFSSSRYLFDTQSKTTKRIFSTATVMRTQAKNIVPNNKVPKSVAEKVKDTMSEIVTTQTKNERNATDWAIIKQMMKYIWPKNDIGVKTRVVVALSLLVGGKVSPLP